MSSHEPSSGLMSSHECSWTLMSTHKYWAMAPRGFISASKGQWPHGSRLMTTLKLSLSAHCSLAPSSWEFVAAHEWSWAIMSSHEHPSALMSFHKQPRAAMSVYDCSWALMPSHEHSSTWRHGAMGTHESLKEVMSMASWGLRPSLALLLPKYYTHECSWSQMSTHEHSWALMSPHDS